jgi:hypothetical protein
LIGKEGVNRFSPLGPPKQILNIFPGSECCSVAGLRDLVDNFQMVELLDLVEEK